jgi:outer membrane protein assembly factor BamB
MKTQRIVAALVLAAGSVAVASSQSPPPGDWPQWRGPARDGISRETGLAQSWPAGGPPLVWAASGLGSGYGSLAIKDGRIFVQALRDRQSMLHSLRVADGTYVWSKTIGSGGSNDRGPGPRGTPTLDGDRVYALSERGDLICVQADDATVVWQRNILNDFNGRNIGWLLSESPLVDGDKVVVTPGGRGAGIVALDKMTGRTIWTASELSDEAGYSSIVIADVQGVRAYTTLMGSAAVGVRASDGKLLWRYEAPANRTANIATPIVQANQVFYTSAYGTGGGLVTLQPANGGLTAREVYFTREMQNHHGGVVLVNGTLYGFNNAILAALDFASGRPLWRNRSVGKGAVTYADGRLYILSENNVMGLAEVSPAGYREAGRFEIADQGLPSWAHPVVAGGRLYIRHQNRLWAYDVRRQS